jgi:hypothetical protein
MPFFKRDDSTPILTEMHASPNGEEKSEESDDWPQPIRPNSVIKGMISKDGDLLISPERNIEMIDQKKSDDRGEDVSHPQKRGLFLLICV